MLKLFPVNRNPLNVFMEFANFMFDVFIGFIKIVIDNGVVEISSVNFLYFFTLLHWSDELLLLHAETNKINWTWLLPLVEYISYFPWPYVCFLLIISRLRFYCESYHYDFLKD